MYEPFDLQVGVLTIFAEAQRRSREPSLFFAVAKPREAALEPHAPRRGRLPVKLRPYVQAHRPEPEQVIACACGGVKVLRVGCLHPVHLGKRCKAA